MNNQLMPITINTMKEDKVSLAFWKIFYKEPIRFLKD